MNLQKALQHLRTAAKYRVREDAQKDAERLFNTGTAHSEIPYKGVYGTNRIRHVETPEGQHLVIEQEQRPGKQPPHRW